MVYKGIDLTKNPRIKDEKRYTNLLSEDGFITRKEYETYDNKSKGNDFRYAFELFNKLIEEGRYSIALPIICSMIDDRETRLLFYIISKNKDQFEWENNIDNINYRQLSELSWRIKTNILTEFFGKEFADEHFRIKMLRAELIHLLVFNLNEERSQKLCDLYYNHFRVLDQHVRRIKKG
jgi:hypothetical protein